jgi:hypothetical protein
MALDISPFARCTVTFKDRDNNRSRTSFNLPHGETETVTWDKAQAIAAAMALLLDSVLVHLAIVYEWVDPVASALQAPEGSDVERKGRFSFQAINGQHSRLELPSIKNTLVVDGSNTINVGDPLVAAFVALMASPTAGAELFPVTNTGSQFAALVPPAVKIHRASSQG